jgi:hypothetical protein
LKFFIEKLIGVEDARLLRDRRAGETLESKTSECGSPPCPAESEQPGAEINHIQNKIKNWLVASQFTLSISYSI